MKLTRQFYCFACFPTLKVDNFHFCSVFNAPNHLFVNQHHQGY